MIPETPGLNDVETFSGKYINIQRMSSQDISIEDIAHGLSMLCRFAGQCRSFYSVAEHSVLVAGEVERNHPGKPGLILEALLHDASEAYVGDIRSPLKKLECMAPIRSMEREIQQRIWEHFGLFHPPESSKIIGLWDLAVLKCEARELLGSRGYGWHLPEDLPEIKGLIHSWSPAKAEQEFLALFHHYYTIEPPYLTTHTWADDQFVEVVRPRQGRPGTLEGHRWRV